MIKRGNDMRLSVKTLHMCRVRKYAWKHDLKGHYSIQALLPRFVDHPHPAASDLIENFVIANGGVGFRKDVAPGSRRQFGISRAPRLAGGTAHKAARGTIW